MGLIIFIISLILLGAICIYITPPLCFKSLKNCSFEGMNSLLTFLVYLMFTIITSYISDFILQLLLSPYERTSKHVSKYLEEYIVKKGLDKITTYLFIIYVIVYLIIFLFIISYYKRNISDKAEIMNRLKYKNINILSKISIYWLEAYSIVIGFLNNNIKDLIKGNMFALIIILAIPAIVFISLIAMTVSSEKIFLKSNSK